MGWPACGEIDIMEHKDSDQNRIYGTLHYPGRSGGNANGNTVIVSNATTDFNIYAVEWNASIIKFSVNGNVFHSVANSTVIPFNHNFFIILNLAMGALLEGLLILHLLMLLWKLIMLECISNSIFIFSRF